jgi:hypothetical protein
VANTLNLHRNLAVGFIDWLGGVFGHSSTNKFFHKTGRKGFFGRKSNRAFSEIISSQLLAVCSNRVSTDVEGAVPLRSTEGNEQLRVKAVTRNAIAYALFGRWRCSLNVSPKLSTRARERTVSVISVAPYARAAFSDNFGHRNCVILRESAGARCATIRADAQGDCV